MITANLRHQGHQGGWSFWDSFGEKVLDRPFFAVAKEIFLIESNEAYCRITNQSKDGMVERAHASQPCFPFE